MNQEIELLENAFMAQAASINLLMLIVQIILTTLFSYIIGFFYIKYGNSLSNRRNFAKNFVLISVTTMLIIMIVKSSLALSLGLVGALSIVRFRTAIKEPEELAFFFMAIGIGLGIGAEQLVVTAIGTVGLCTIIYFLNRKKSETVAQNLIIKFDKTNKQSTEAFIKSLEGYCSELNLRRLDENSDRSEISFDIRFNSLSDLLAAKEKMQADFPGSSFSFLQMV